MGITGSRGRAAETLAAAFLELSGLEVVERNVRLAGVEVDVLAVERGVHVVVEVKFRSRSDYGGALEALDPGKRARLLRAASVLAARGDSDVRIDLIAVTLDPEGAVLRHVRGAVSA
jgi:putative endonuclease